MPTRKYLFEGRDQRGGAQSGYIEAESVDQARERLELRGLQEAVLLDDDLGADTRRLGEESGFTADSSVDLFSRYHSGVAAIALLAVRKNAVLIAIGALLAAYLAFSGSHAWALGVAACDLLLVAFPAWTQWQHNELYARFWRRDYEGSERVARRLAAVPMLRRVKPLRLELDGSIAGARICRGRTAEGFAIMSAWEADADMPRPMVLAKMSGLYFLARDWPGYLGVLEEALQASGNADYARIDLAQSLARVGDDDARARELLAGVNARALGPLHLAFIAWAEGVLALRAGDDPRALQALTRAVAQMEKIASNPVLWGALALCIGYLAVALARTGARDRAAEALAMVQPIVETHAEDRLIGWLRDAGLVPLQPKRPVM